jgi:hypothetical protein
MAPAIALAQSNLRVIKVPDATALRLALSEPLSSATSEVDDPARFEVIEGVSVGGLVVIPKGSTAVGHVVEVEPKRRLGRAGKLNLMLDHVKAIDGSNLRLRAVSSRKGADKTGTVIVGTVLLSPLFLIMRGKDVSLPKGTSVTAYIDGDRDVSLPASNIDTPWRVRPEPLETSAPTTDASFVSVKSDPDGAEIIVDSQFFGNTPSTIQLPPGDHLVSIQKPGYLLWQRGVTINSWGVVTIKGLLQPRNGAQDAGLKANR